MFKLIRRANFEAISADFSSVDQTKELNDLNAKQSYSKFHNFYEKTSEKNIPKVREKVKKSSEIWMTREVKDAVREKHQSQYRLKKGEGRTNHRRSCKNFNHIITKARNQFENSIAAKSKKEPKLVNAYVRRKLVAKDSVKMLKNDEADLITNKVDIAKMLNDYFHSIFAKESDFISPSFAKRTKMSLSI